MHAMQPGRWGPNLLDHGPLHESLNSNADESRGFKKREGKKRSSKSSNGIQSYIYKHQKHP